MRIVYFITTLNKNSGKGGHYNSLKTLAQEISLVKDVTVINIGVRDSIILNQSEKNFKYIFLEVSLISFLLSFKKLLSIVNKINPDVIHCFDRSSYLWGSYIAKILKIKLFLTKCGGNIPSWFPNAKNFIVFNPKDFDYYKTKNSKNNSISLIPNRVTPISTDKKRIKQLRDQYVKDGELILLRIARFTQLNRPSIKQSLNLINSLSKNLNIRLLIIGDIHEKSVYDEFLNKINSSNTTIITDPYFTKNAQELIPIANLVVSSGRSLMETSFFEIPVLVPNSNFDIPVLLTKKTFDAAYYENFSYRTNFNDLSKTYEDVLNEIREVITIEAHRELNRDFLVTLNNVYFLLNPIIPKYIKLYQDAKLSSFRNLIMDFVINFIFVGKAIK